MNYVSIYRGEAFLGSASGKAPSCQCRRCKRCGFNACVGKIPWRRAWQPTSVFLPGDSPWTEEPGGLQSTGSQRVTHNWTTEAEHNTTSHNLRPHPSSFTLPFIHLSSLVLLFLRMLLLFFLFNINFSAIIFFIKHCINCIPYFFICFVFTSHHLKMVSSVPCDIFFFDSLVI